MLRSRTSRQNTVTARPTASSTRRRARRWLAPLLCALAAALSALAIALPTSWGFSIQHGPNVPLDGKVLVSPAAERVTSIVQGGAALIGPGARFTRPLLIQNRGKTPATFDLDVAEVVGGADVVNVVHSRLGAAAWVTLERPTVTLRPGDTATLNVMVNIPKLIKPGTKSFAVTVTQHPTQQQTSGAGVTPVFEQDAIFVLELPGNAPIHGNITQAQIVSDKQQQEGGPNADKKHMWFIGQQSLSLNLGYHNSGERMLTPQGSLELRDLFGRLVGHYAIAHLTVYPEGGTTTATVKLKGLPWFGILHGKVTLDSQAGHQTKNIGWIIVAPVWLEWAAYAVLIVIGLLLLVWGFRLLRRKLAERRALSGYDDEDDDAYGHDDEHGDYDADDDEDGYEDEA
jgi:hypothetical protein